MNPTCEPSQFKHQNGDIMRLTILALAAAASLSTLSGCSTTASSNTTYAQTGQSGPGAVSIPLN
jgi:hypothetical protein